MAKFGIALGSGPRGLGFESRHSDQKTGDRICGHRFFNWCDGVRKAVKKTCRWHVFRPWENPLVSGRTPCGCGQKSNIRYMKPHNNNATKIVGMTFAIPTIFIIIRKSINCNLSINQMLSHSYRILHFAKNVKKAGG